MAKRKGLGLFAKLLISFAVIVVVLVVGVVTVLHLTPNHFNLGDVNIAGTTLNQLGLGDEKFIDIIDSFIALKNPNRDAIVTNSPTDDDKASVTDKIKDNSTIPTDTDGSPDFSILATEVVCYDNEYLISYTDKELAGLFGHIIDDAEDKVDSPEGIQMLADLDANIESITISDKKDDGSASIRIVASVGLELIKEEIAENLPAFLVNQIPEKVYLASYGTISADSNGDVVYTHVNCLINDKDDIMSQAIFAVLASIVDETSDKDSSAIIGEKIGEGFTILMHNLGIVGSADVDENGVVIESTKSYGNQGIHNGSISIITIKDASL